MASKNLTSYSMVGTTLYSFVTMVYSMSPYQLPNFMFCEFRQAKPTELINIAQHIRNLIMLIAVKTVLVHCDT